MISENDRTYYLWLTPENSACSRFAEIIQRLGQKYHSRLFDPHITLASGITGREAELIAKTEILSKRLSRMIIKPQEFNYLNEFYRALFLLIKPDEILINANTIAKQFFALPSNQEFMPHLSLFYGDLPAKEKREIICKIDPKLLEQFHVNKIALFCTCQNSNKWYLVKSFELIGMD